MAGILKVDQYQDFNGNNIMTSDGSGNITINAAAMKATPAFMVYLSADQTLSDNTYAKIQFDTEVFDTDSAYDNSTNYRFTVPSGAAGKYSITYHLLLYDASGKLLGCRNALYKNGSVLQEGIRELDAGLSNPFYNDTGVATTLVDLSVGDYLEVYGRGNTTDSGSFIVDGDASQYYSYFSGYKLIGA